MTSTDCGALVSLQLLSLRVHLILPHVSKRVLACNSTNAAITVLSVFDEQCLRWGQTGGHQFWQLLAKVCVCLEQYRQESHLS